MSGFELIPALQTAGTFLSGAATVGTGIAANNAARFEAQQLDRKAKEEFAASQREAAAKRREGALLNSRAQAVAAASGAGAGEDAPTIVKIMSDIAGESEYNAQAELYGGRARAAGLRTQAKSRRASGQASLLGSAFGGIGQIASGLPGGSFMKRPTDPWAGLRA